MEVELAARVADYDAVRHFWVNTPTERLTRSPFFSQILQDFTLASAELQELEALLKEKDPDISILRAEIEGRNGEVK